MKRIMIFLVILILTACNNPDEGVSIATNAAANSKVVNSKNPIHNSDLLTLADAEKILGEPAHLIDSTVKPKGQDPKYIDSVSIFKKEAVIYNCGYMANSKDEKSRKTGVIYFSLEQYADVSSAKNVYSFYKKSNVHAIGYKELHDVGDEAWFGSSPLFVSVRKADKIFGIKVNKMTSKTSENEFNLVVKKIAENL